MNEALLQDALRLRRAGKLSQAAELYGEVLRSEPKHFEALHALGILHYQGGRLEEAVRLIGEASNVNPRAADAAYNHACLLQRLNRLEEALVSFDRALAIKPDYLEALVNRGGVLWALKRYDEALANTAAVSFKFSTASRRRLKPMTAQLRSSPTTPMRGRISARC
jgi:tetratricopeptide (TPR) repeat protein